MASGTRLVAYYTKPEWPAKVANIYIGHKRCIRIPVACLAWERRLTNSWLGPYTGCNRQSLQWEASVNPLQMDIEFVGAWLSLVEHLVRDQGVGGSNPLAPTNKIKRLQFF
jgi:hypothetical protein